MKRIYQILVLAILVILNTSCLKSGLDELETYNLNDITNVRFEYRWWNESEQRMRIIEMNVDKSIDKENKKISCTEVGRILHEGFCEPVGFQLY